MVQSKAKRRKITQSLNLQCLKCDHDCVGFLLPNGVVESYQLSRHLNSRPSCMAFYTVHVPQRQNHNKRTLPFDFSTSVKSDLTQHIETKIMSKTTSFTSSDFALSGTQNGPCDFQNFDIPSHTSDPNVMSHQHLNKQTLYHGNTPVVCRQNISSALNNSNDECLVSPHSSHTAQLNSSLLLHPTGNTPTGEPKNRLNRLSYWVDWFVYLL